MPILFTEADSTLYWLSSRARACCSTLFQIGTALSGDSPWEECEICWGLLMGEARQVLFVDPCRTTSLAEVLRVLQGLTPETLALSNSRQCEQGLLMADLPADHPLEQPLSFAILQVRGGTVQTFLFAQDRSIAALTGSLAALLEEVERERARKER